jgi:phage FluMu gp28-like protein
MTDIGIGKVLGGGTVNDPNWYKDFDANEVLLQYQRDWVADPSQLKIAEKSRRTGLTWAEAADGTLCAGASRAAGGCNHFYVGSNKEMAREFIDAVAMWAKLY